MSEDELAVEAYIGRRGTGSVISAMLRSNERLSSILIVLTVALAAASIVLAIYGRANASTSRSSGRSIPTQKFATPSEQYQACDKRATTQFSMDICASEELRRVDAELDRVYAEALSRVKRDPVASAKVAWANRAWKAYRDAYIDAMYPAKDKLAHYGSIYPLEVDMLRAGLTRVQVAALTCLRLGPRNLITGSTPCPF